MSAAATVLSSLGLDHLLVDATVLRTPSDTLVETSGAIVAGLSPAALRALRHVLSGERPGAWRELGQACGRAAGRATAVRLDAQLAALGKPLLAALPLEASLALLSRVFAAHGWGKLSVDLTLASDHGLVLATLEHSAFAEALSGTPDFVDAVPAGFLSAFFEHLSGQSLACEEIACRSRGAPYCRFVVTAAARLAPIVPLVGRETAEALLARLRQ